MFHNNGHSHKYIKDDLKHISDNFYFVLASPITLSLYMINKTFNYVCKRR